MVRKNFELIIGKSFTCQVTPVIIYGDNTKGSGEDMFLRITKLIQNSHQYEYLLISESVHVKGKGSTTKNVTSLGNMKKFKYKNMNNLINRFNNNKLSSIKPDGVLNLVYRYAASGEKFNPKRLKYRTW